TSFDKLQQAAEPRTDYVANAGCLRPLKNRGQRSLYGGYHHVSCGSSSQWRISK
ncbi:hypothetical protein FQN60_008312, partial [Etheostoma spectabile]